MDKVKEIKSKLDKIGIGEKERNEEIQIHNDMLIRNIEQNLNKARDLILSGYQELTIIKSKLMEEEYKLAMRSRKLMIFPSHIEDIQEQMKFVNENIHFILVNKFDNTDEEDK